MNATVKKALINLFIIGSVIVALTSGYKLG
ncbi:hypothetical protein HNQ85_003267 [Anoxybacillus calidus]|jgi:hypothetical protein|uniref:Uncharacterized protein n=2 Tax=Paranoxybacillus TaxID=3390015 RepID=A0A7V9Z2T4_9BACL|nr:hypothetical protein [Anoxybacillus calidus]RAK18272.1 hypothetical protein B0I26_11190 [Anoxybacillus vitaminiphilus]